MGATGCEFDVNEVAASTDRIMEACDKLDEVKNERVENVLNMLQQCMHKDVDSPALALHHALKALRDGIIPAASALSLAKLYLARVTMEVERLERPALSADTAHLMSICTAPYTKA